MTKGRRLSRTRKQAGWILAALFAATLAIGATHRGIPTSGIPGLGNDPVASTARDGAVSIRGSLDRSAVLRGDDGLVRMELVLRADGLGNGAAPQLPTDLVVVLDRSGSMNGRKLQDAQAAIHHLVSRLGPEDRFALVTFASDSALAIPLGYATPSARADWDRLVDAVHAGGGTYMSQGLALGLDTLRAATAAGRAPRAIVLSDGLAAEPPAVLRAQAAAAAADELSLSAVGIGADFDEDLMAALADAGTGNYYYLRDVRRLASVFAAEFETARETVAAGVRVSFEPAPGVAVVEAAGYPLERRGDAASFRPGTLFAGQERHVWVTLRVPTNALAEYALGHVRVDYSDGGEPRQLRLDGLPKVACVAEPERFFAALDGDAWAKSVVVEEYNQLRQSVAGLVKAGRPAEAKAEIERFQSRNRALNDVVASPQVSRQLEAAGSLEADVDAAFRGPDARQKQNLLGKSLQAQGILERRAGSRK